MSFRNDVRAVLSKAGCNQGICHGNKNGKGGFKLSLRGEDPEWDYRVLAREHLGRRIDTVVPERSLILLKPTLAVRHEGGERFKEDSLEYRILHSWIAAGAPRDPPDTPHLRALKVEPREAVIEEPVEEVPLRVEALFSDGTRRDVTRLAVYETSAPLCEVSPGGVARRLGFGEVTVLVRFLELQVPVRLAFVRAAADFRWPQVPEEHPVDRYVFAKLRRLKIAPSPLADDRVFLRRAYLDLLGLVPAPEEARAFLEDPRPDKRERLIDRLLERDEFADFWALKWADLLRVEEKSLDRKGVQAFHHWLREAIARRVPLDRMVREILAARGSTYRNPPANFYRALRDPLERAEAVAQAFLGVRLKCARCHNHPFDRWTQDDYYDWAAVFAGVRYEVLENRRRDSNDKHEFDGEQIVWFDEEAQVENARTGRPAVPRFLGTRTPIGAGGDRLERVATWVTSPSNAYFTRLLANRIWYHLMGRGLVDPADDVRATNPPSHPGLLEELARRLAASGYDLRALIRFIMTSRTYQLSSLPTDSNRSDETNYSHARVRRLTAEQLLDAQCAALGAAVRFNGYPTGIRAAQIPGVRAVRARDARPAPGDRFLAVFGKPPRLLACECERSEATTMSQAFQLVSGPVLHELLTQPENRLGKLLASGKDDAWVIEELYWAVLSRPPGEAERRAALALLSRARGPAERRQALEDIAWSLLNAKEFLLRW